MRQCRYIISGISNDKIQAKIFKEVNDLSFVLVMEIARFEMSTQKHLQRM